MEGAGTDLQVERLDQHAALIRPEGVQTLDQFLERRERAWGHTDAVQQGALV